MPRKTRIYFRHGFYHIFNRGVEKRQIFNEDKDYERFLNKLEDLTRELDFSVFCYAILPNHFHISLETRKTSLSKIVGRLLTSYALYFNKNYQRVGPLFQDRYKSILVQKDNYFLQLSRYIHLNPVSAGIVSNPLDYPYSSFAELFGKSKWNIIDRKEIVRLIGETKDSLDEYKKFVHEGIDESSEFDIFEDNREVLGSRSFNTSAQKKFLRRKKRQI